MKRRAQPNDQLEKEFKPKSKRVKKMKKVIPMDCLSYQTFSSPLLPQFLYNFERIRFELIENRFYFVNFDNVIRFESVTISQIEGENLLEKRILGYLEDSSDSSDQEKPHKSSKNEIKKKTRNEYLERRKKILDLHLDKYESAKIATRLSEKPKFVYQVISEYRNNGIVAPQRRGRKYKTKYAHLQFLHNFIISNIGKTITLGMIRKHLLENFHTEDLKLHITTVYRMLKELNISRKRSS